MSKTKPKKNNTQWKETVRKINGEQRRVMVRYHNGKPQIKVLQHIIKPAFTQAQFDNLKAEQCRGVTEDFTRCKNMTKNPNGFCPDHINQSKQSEWGKLMDRKRTNKLVLPFTPENAKLWASNPQKYDLEGFDTKLDPDSAEYKKALESYRNSQIFKAFKEKQTGRIEDESPWDYVKYQKKVNTQQLREEYEIEQNEIAFEEAELREPIQPKRTRKPEIKAVQCKHVTTIVKKGREGHQQCKRMTKDPSGFCADHNPNYGKHIYHGKGVKRFRSTPDGKYHSKDTLEKDLESIAQAQGDHADVYMAALDKIGVDDQLTEDENWDRVKAEIQSYAWA